MKDVLVEFVTFLKYRKRLWLMPIFIVIILLALLVVFGQTSVLSPFIYTLI